MRRTRSGHNIINIINKIYFHNFYIKQVALCIRHMCSPFLKPTFDILSWIPFVEGYTRILMSILCQMLITFKAFLANVQMRFMTLNTCSVLTELTLKVQIFLTFCVVRGKFSFPTFRLSTQSTKSFMQLSDIITLHGNQSIKITLNVA